MSQSPFSNRELQARVKALLRHYRLVSVDSQESDGKKSVTSDWRFGNCSRRLRGQKYGEESLATVSLALISLASHIGQK